MTTKVSGPKPDQMSSLLPVIGGAIGSIYGGPAGGAVGGQLGGMLGSSNVGSVELAQKRLDKQNSLSDLQKGQEALANQSPEMQEKFAPVLEQAMVQAQPQQQQQQKPFLPRKEM